MSKGKQPRTRVKVPKLLLSENKVVFNTYVQEIGLEAAIFWRSRKRALAQQKTFFCILFKSTEDLTDLNNTPTPCPFYNNRTKTYYVIIKRGSRTLGKF